MKILKIFKETISDGPGIRYSIYVAGCLHACKGCHNLLSWSFKLGKDFDQNYEKQIISDLKSNPLLSGVTFSGGDPMFSAKEVYKLIKRIKKETGLNIWLYTGFTIEEIYNQRNNGEEELYRFKILHEIDILVDGRWVQELYDPSLDFRGSSNQRLIDTKKWLIDIKNNKNL
ncbi:anaerobic ribonucleoside-triphosphate reductase activating protein [Spiroplasma turonicum]|uniref:Anaerobic ribonucleoside-triphosphate reductase-activating protein n=1 Tax=Spiroplasma turonicum TaxID=216946 RepID=A0A0K1P4W1_9MOLU|nr:anaerobic ribonucleoside-triphosphate reductase activating protein [Spiroplasma turonicum]AKU79328.1 anaerobic ribonucleoside-triphosphate reductase activating protein [Spiroplasma turonicum]ALX70349.1 anaerobic ribonucleoside-triphosphate reductase activating protein [Spiroplasma turonicum]